MELESLMQVHNVGTALWKQNKREMTLWEQSSQSAKQYPDKTANHRTIQSYAEMVLLSELELWCRLAKNSTEKSTREFESEPKQRTRTMIRKFRTWNCESLIGNTRELCDKLTVRKFDIVHYLPELQQYSKNLAICNLLPAQPTLSLHLMITTSNWITSQPSSNWLKALLRH